jgi:hypothetical protein
MIWEALKEWASDKPWLRYANCHGADMFPDNVPRNPKNSRSHSYRFTADEVEAKDLCGDCQVRVECLTYAIEAKEKFGVWGGLTEQQRIDIAVFNRNTPERFLTHALHQSQIEKARYNAKRRERDSRATA